MFIDELACLSYWDIIDEDRKGYLDYNEFVRALKMFRFHLQPWTLSAIRNEFEWLLKWNKEEVLDEMDEDNFVARFNFARLIFLERQL